MALLSDIQSNTWGISTIATGIIVEGFASLRQCIHVILKTTKGTDPLRPNFGSNIYKYVDVPLNIAIPNIKKEIITALSIWEKRISVKQVKHYLRSESHVEFEIIYGIEDTALLESIVIDFNGTGVSQLNDKLVLQALFPPGIDVKMNNIDFMLNNKNVLPNPPKYGFINVKETFEWVLANWGNYGKWYLLADRIVCYLNPGKYSQASLKITVNAILKFAANIPSLELGEKYKIIFNPDNEGIFESDLVLTKEELLAYAVNNWLKYGDWQIEYSGKIDKDFNQDFNNDFDSQTDNYELVLYSPNVLAAQLEVAIV